MKQIKSIWFAITLIITFLAITACYNGTRGASIFLGLTGGFGGPFIPQFLLPSVLLITVSALNKKWLTVSGVILMVLLLFWFMYLLYGVLEFSLLSALPFFTASGLTIWYLLCENPLKYKAAPQIKLLLLLLILWFLPEIILNILYFYKTYDYIIYVYQSKIYFGLLLAIVFVFNVIRVAPWERIIPKNKVG